MSELGLAVQVAFIAAGCTYVTYHKTLRALGIDGVCPQSFQYTLEMMHPIVKQMLDEMCDEAKKDMHDMDQNELGSWSRAVTSADGTWQTRGFHSKNATFSIRNYFNGALLYYKHLNQRGSDTIVEEELYEGTSKSAEGFAAKYTFNRAKEEGMQLEIHFQDNDSSSSNAVIDHFPNAKVMICGGHAGRAHKKQLQKLAKMKSFSEDFQTKYCDRFPSVSSVKCCCPCRHRPGCGCMSDAFIEKARNNFSCVLSESNSAKEFVEKLLVLPRHARNEHEWEGGCCGFHPLRVCSCGNCKDPDNLECTGKPYSTKCVLSCPLHALAYEIEIHARAAMAEDLVHPVLKRGHSNWLEASHNVLIRFRSKDISLQRLHYHVSTNLGLLQSNMTYMFDKRGPSYHWLQELFHRMKLPVYDDLLKHLESENRLRKQQLDDQKTEKKKRRRIELKKERTTEAQRRKEWSKKHGKDTYGDAEKDSLQTKATRVSGSTKTRKRSSHTESSQNIKKKKLALVSDTDHSNSEFCQVSADNPLSEENLEFPSSDEDFEENLYHDECTCNAYGRAHKTGCPLNPHSRFCGRVLFTKESSDASRPNHEASNPKLNVSTMLREKGNCQPHPDKKLQCNFTVGDYVCLHSSILDKRHVHVPCRVIQVFGANYRLYCQKGVLKGKYSSHQLMPLSSDLYIPLEDWRVSAQVHLHKVIHDSTCLQFCDCVLDVSSTNSTVPLEVSDTESECVTESLYWIRNALYTLTTDDREEVISPSGWLSDKIIAAAQLLIFQQYPDVSGLQNPILQETLAFQVHTKEFVQIIHVRRSHWCTISNVGCKVGEVNVYDSLYTSVPHATLRVIASLMFSSVSQLNIRIMDVERQSNGSDCGVLAIAYAYELCSHNDPCKVKFDHNSIRLHLAKSLENCSLFQFPVSGERSSKGVIRNQTVDLHCSCHMPEEKGDEMAECDVCKTWYHKHCQDIPVDVFTGVDVPWKCRGCSTL